MFIPFHVSRHRRLWLVMSAAVAVAVAKGAAAAAAAEAEVDTNTEFLIHIIYTNNNWHRINAHENIQIHAPHR